ncbi:MAG TPA: HAD family hydrolase [Jatrophihabitans sp.]|uniref:HAD family hydrolase n=1 Tax=Jatrophihabitans sp. TaxID=1932789 RepID=UPI002E06F05A|nr:HAD family hydrolase [Jatrophihabitans sp.]
MDAPTAVLFDFSGTLFHVESAAEAVRAALGVEHLHRAPDLARWGAINGSGVPDGLPEAMRDVWERRDLSAAAHRAAYSGMARHAGLSEEQAHALYERGVAAEAWSPYPDTVPVLRRLRQRGVPVAVVSNIGWNPRPVLAHHGVADLIDVLVLSDERGVLKPDPAIFRLALDELGVAAGGTVMVGDNEVNDGGATALGLRFVLVPEDPAQRAPDALLRAAGL